MILLNNETKERILENAHNAFPNEGCGFLFGEERDGIRYLFDFLPVINAQEGDQRRLFQISSGDYLKAERYADEHHLQLLSIYHSHPNAPAIPSEYDRKAAQPFFSYVILSITEESDPEVRSWVLNDDFQFEEERISTSLLQESVSI